MIECRLALTADQIAAATAIHARLRFWTQTDRALDAIATRFPEFDLGACLVKTVAVNQLYGTNVYAVTRMAEHVERVMARAQHDELVEQLAAATLGLKTKRHVSFASKFAHFFVDKDAYPICDSYAIAGLRRHLSGTGLLAGEVPRYAVYVAAHSALRRLTGVPCSGRELDRYLWLSGLYHAWTRNAEAPINVEVRDIFVHAESDNDLRTELRRLVGDETPEHTTVT